MRCASSRIGVYFTARVRVVMPVIAVMGCILSACAPYNDNMGLAESILAADIARHTPTDLRSLTYVTVDGMLKENASLGASGEPMVVGSIADIQNINSTTPLGNTIAELVRSRLVQKQLTITDLRLRSKVLLDQRQGELMLSRDVRAVLPPPVAAEV